MKLFYSSLDCGAESVPLKHIRMLVQLEARSRNYFEW